ncbi:MAG: nucleotide exchange factor GrpE [Gemmatimonadetes bacterium]|nr:nucleotide exchange factor GrpE [Gemmatimonadota bacterium]
MTKHFGFRDHDMPERDREDPGSIADGDASLDGDPPNVSEAQPPADWITRDPVESGPGRGGRSGSDGRGGETDPETEQEAEQIESDIDELRRDFSTLSDRHVRLAAEFDNYRKRIERERAEAWTRAQGDLAARLLDALDDLERFANHAAQTDDALLQGVQLVERKLRQSLISAGLEEVDAEGARFDPNSMEAVAMIPAESQEDDDIVSDVFQRGYLFKGNLIRPARVRVKKHGA